MPLMRKESSLPLRLFTHELLNENNDRKDEALE
jgi:hypothetical protein